MDKEKQQQVNYLLNQWLETLPEITCFLQKMKIYVPTCHGECDREVTQLRDNMNRLFGGSTTYETATGCWYDKKGDKVICEPIKVIEIAHNCSDKAKLREMAEAITEYAVKANQASISIHAGTFYIAETPEMVSKLEEETKIR